jgi:hypothetical protein
MAHNEKSLGREIHAKTSLGKRNARNFQQLDCSNSTCFAAVEFDKQNEVATMLFNHSPGPYDVDCSSAEWKAWKDDESKGGFYNAELAE